MEYRYLGSSGLQVSALSLGSWVTFGEQIDTDVAYDCMTAAYEAGVNFFDNAEGYAGGKSESMMGEVIKKAGWKRSDLVISTKIFWGGDGPNDRGLSRKHILEGIDASLTRLQLTYVDLIFCHRPDIHTPVEETVRAMTQVIGHGKAFYWGTSEWSAEQIKDAVCVARREHLIPPQMEQPEYNMFNRERVEKEYARLYRDFGLGTTIYSSLASGLLTGKYNEGIPQGTRATLPDYQWLREDFERKEAKQNIEKVKRIQPIAEELGCTMAQLALAWCLKNPSVSTVITGASRPEQVQENMKALEIVARLTDPVLERIESILENKPHPEPDFREE
ncbi:MAG TPA: aldo/keto reductase [Anaerolineales bacterium]|nr:aldo/keto reductase [Anaerolineales bacterium]